MYRKINHVLSGLGRLVVATVLIGLVAATAWGASGSRHRIGENPGVIISVHGSEFKFVPNVIKIVKGQKVTIIFTNDGVLAHNFAVPALGLKTETIQSHDTARLVFTPDKAGSFRFRCLVPGHMEAGMRGKLIVVDSR